jgi:hypothetical protein
MNCRIKRNASQNTLAEVALPVGGKGISLLLWKIWTQFSPILGENIFQIFSNFGRKYLSNLFQFWQRKSFKLPPILGEDTG